jgi:hypothetical protein
MAAALLFGWIPTWRFTPFVVMVIYTITLGPTWPTLEAAILHAPGAASMPRRLGLYNVTWGFSDAAGFFASGFLFGWKPDSILWATGLLHLGQWCWFRLAPRNLGDIGETAMEMPHSGDDVPAPVKRRFMHSAWLANGMGFLMLAGFTALAPQVGDGLRLAPSFTIWLTCTHLFARGQTVAAIQSCAPHLQNFFPIPPFRRNAFHWGVSSVGEPFIRLTSMRESGNDKGRHSVFMNWSSKPFFKNFSFVFQDLPVIIKAYARSHETK